MLINLISCKLDNVLIYDFWHMRIVLHLHCNSNKLPIRGGGRRQPSIKDLSANQNFAKISLKPHGHDLKEILVLDPLL